MTRIFAERLSFAFSELAPIADSSSFVLEPGFCGLVGPNGAGKTTILRLLAGELAPVSGAVRFEPEGALAVLCPQELETATPDVVRLAGSNERADHRLRASLGLERFDEWRVLSPGERKRWQIGAALAREPDVLLLDEPTNHLDAGAREWLLAALSRFEGVGVVVSHDRELLDRLTTQTLRLEGGALRSYPGAYSAARATWEAERHTARAERELSKQRVARLGQRLHQAASRQAQSSAERSTRRRMKNRHDSDARGCLAQTRADWADAVHGRQVKLVKRELAQARAELGEHEAHKELGGTVFARFEPARSSLVLWREAGPLCAGERVLFDAPALGVRRDDRIWIAGDNGAGKSTLLGELAAGMRIEPDELMVLPQDLAIADALRMLETVRSLDAEAKGRVLSILAALGVDPDRLLVSERPSPGEARKLAIATGLGRLARALVLDEPENHLDLPSIERLEAALAAYPGALLIVTHDVALATSTATTRWQLGRTGIQVSALGH